jgi:hypothetical protein
MAQHLAIGALQAHPRPRAPAIDAYPKFNHGLSALFVTLFCLCRTCQQAIVGTIGRPDVVVNRYLSGIKNIQSGLACQAIICCVGY